MPQETVFKQVSYLTLILKKKKQFIPVYYKNAMKPQNYVQLITSNITELWELSLQFYAITEGEKRHWILIPPTKFWFKILHLTFSYYSLPPAPFNTKLLFSTSFAALKLSSLPTPHVLLKNVVTRRRQLLLSPPDVPQREPQMKSWPYNKLRRLPLTSAGLRFLTYPSISKGDFALLLFSAFINFFLKEEHSNKVTNHFVTLP